MKMICGLAGCVLAAALIADGAQAEEQPEATSVDKERTMYKCRKINDEQVKVDGLMDEPFWKDIPAMNLVHIKDGAQPAVKSLVRMAWSAENLYVFADLEDDNIFATILEHDGNIWSEDAFELFINPVPEQMLPYIEFEVNPRGGFFDAIVYDTHKCLSKVYEQPWKHNYNPPGIEVQTVIVEQPRPKWFVELKIPFKAMVLTQPMPVQAGHRWRMGVYRINKLSEKQTEEYSWQVVPDGRFHAPEKFGELLFVDEPGAK